MSAVAGSVEPSAVATETETKVLEAAPEAQDDGTQVDPWNVTGQVDFDKLIDKFGSQRIDAALLERTERLIGEPLHPWLRRGIFFSHRDLSLILDKFENKEPFFLYTGRGPSSGALHLGHLVPFQFTQWLQRVFNCPLVIQLTDDEKFLFSKRNQTLEETRALGYDNARDIIACGFDVTKTFIFRNTDYMQFLWPVAVRVANAVNANRASAFFGFDGSSSIGKYFFPSIQAAPSFSACFPNLFGGRENVPCLIPCAIDQDLYFRLTRDVAGPLKWEKPCLIHSIFFPALAGPRTKMSASDPNSAIYLTDSPEMIADKIKKHAFSGGRMDLAEHRRLGGDCNVDVSYQYLTFFLDDDERLEEIRRAYTAGEMTTSELKAELIAVLSKLVGDFQARRARITDEVVDAFFAVRDMTNLTG